MKIIAAFDSFKNSLSAIKACKVATDTLCKLLGEGTEVIEKPMADGGEGTAEVLMKTLNGRCIARKVTGTLPEMQVEAGFAWFQEQRTAVVEMAKASGLELITKEQMNPLKTTTYGTGELIKAAVEYGAEKILMAVGGSATVDGGAGAAAALGWRFLDGEGKEIPLGGGGLSKLATIEGAGEVVLPQVEVLCDVENPLCGERGAARIYGPQKGATAEMVEELEKNLLHLSRVVEQQLGRDINNIAGAGAAGGLSAGAVAFMNAAIVSGIDSVIEFSGLKDEMENADWIITGEGSFDSQSLDGKVVSGIAKQASETGCKVAVIAGTVEVKREVYQKHGIAEALGCKKEEMSLEYALRNAESLLESAVAEFVKRLGEWL